MPGDDAVPHRQHGLDHTRHAGGGAQVSDVGLDGADQERGFRRAPAPVDRRRGTEFDGIADHGSGAVSLQVVHVGGRHAAAGERLLHGLFLRGAARHGQSLAGTVLIYRRAPDDGPDAVAVGFRLAEALEHEQTATLPADKAIGRRIEGLALSFGRQHSGVGAQLERAPGEEDVDASRKRQIRFVTLDARNRLVDGHEGGRAGGVDRHGRPL